MKILLILPAAEKYRITESSARVPQRRMLRFSILPLTAVAALTPDEHEVQICDENVECLDMNTDAEVIGISFMTALAPRAYALAGEFRKRGKTVVAGGYHPTLCPEEASMHFDAVVAGDAEGIWPRLLEDIVSGELKKIYRSDGCRSLERMPRPRRDLMGKKSRHYATVYAVQATRGCPHSCTYCSIAAFHRGTFRKRPVAEVIAELGAVARDFIFVDDNIIADPDYAKELFRAMIPLGKRWVSQASLKIADDAELLSLAGRAGCRGLFIGIETIGAGNLASVKKGFNAERAVEGRIKALHGAGIGIIAGIIVGMDQDDAASFEATLDFLQKNRIDAVQVNIMTPLPGTLLHRSLREEGRIADEDLSHYDFRHAVIVPARMSRRDLQDGADWLYRSFYRLDRIFLRAIRTLFTLGPAQAVLCWRLNRTYRYDNIREGIVGRNPAEGTRPLRAYAGPWYRYFFRGGWPLLNWLRRGESVNGGGVR